MMRLVSLPGAALLAALPCPAAFATVEPPLHALTVLSSGEVRAQTLAEARAGVERVGEPMLESNRRSDPEHETLVRAVEEAQANASVLATAAGGSLGAVCHAAMRGKGLEPRPGLAEILVAANAARGESIQHYALGELRFHSSVEAGFGLAAAPVR